MVQRFFSVILCALALLLQSCATPTGQPLIYHYGTPWTEASVNGVGGVFLLDTGASISVLDKEFARRAELRPYGSHEVIGTSGSLLADSAWAGSISLADRTHRDRLVSVQNLEGFRAPGGRQQSGLIGCDFFLDYTVVFDLNESRFELLNASAPIAKNMTPYPMQLNGGAPMIEIFLPPATRPTLARLDTGSGYADEGIVYLDMTRNKARVMFGAALERAPDSTTKVLSITGTDELSVYRYGPVRTLGRTLNEVRVVVRESGAGAFLDDDTILLTGSLLRQFGRMELDFPRRTVWVPQ